MTTVPVPHRVARRRPETPDTVSLTLEPVGAPLPPFAPGRFAMVYAFGVGEIPLSVSGIHGDGVVTCTIRAVGAVSRALCGLAEGAPVGVRGPFGTGWDLPSARGHDILVIAGGAGLAPLRPLVRAYLDDPGAYGGLSVLAGARTPADLLFRDEIDGWARPFRAVTVDRPAVDWRGDVGVVTALLDRAPFDPGRTTAFACGPEVMIRATARDLRYRGLPAARVRISIERNMRCATGHCGHCQLGPLLLCRDGPVVTCDRAEHLLAVREL